MKDKNMIQWYTFLCLAIIFFVRLFLNDEQSKWVQIISFLGVVIAIANLYNDIYTQNNGKDKFIIIKGAVVIISVGLIAILIGLFANLIVLDNKGNDILTILSLLISLPNDLYCNWIKKYIEMN